MGLEIYNPAVDYVKKAETKRFDPYSVYGESRSAEYVDKPGASVADQRARQQDATDRLHGRGKYASQDVGSGSIGNIGAVAPPTSALSADPWMTGAARPNIGGAGVVAGGQWTPPPTTTPPPTNSYEGESFYVGPASSGTGSGSVTSSSGTYGTGGQYTPPSGGGGTTQGGGGGTMAYKDPWLPGGSTVPNVGGQGQVAASQPAGAPADYGYQDPWIPSDLGGTGATVPNVGGQGQVAAPWQPPPGDPYVDPNAGVQRSYDYGSPNAPAQTGTSQGGQQASQQTAPSEPRKYGPVLTSATKTETTQKTPGGPPPVMQTPSPMDVPARPSGPEGIEETQMGPMPAYIAPEVEARPELATPGYNQEGEIGKLQQQIAAPGIRQLREMYGTIRSAARGGDPQSRLTLKDALGGYSKGLSEVMSGARTQAAKEYETQYTTNYDASVKNWESQIAEQRDRLTLQTGQAQKNWEAAIQSVRDKYAGQTDARKAEYQAEMDAVNQIYKAEVEAEQVRYANDSRLMASAYESAWKGYLANMSETQTSSVNQSWRLLQ